LDQAPRETDVDGVWAWNEAPLEELMASISRPNGMTLANRPLAPRNEEYIFRVPLLLTISGKVVDAETKQPIKKFRAIPGYVWQGRVSLPDANQITSSKGRYEIRETYEQSAYLVRVEADGFMPAVSRKIKSDEGNVTIDFELVKGNSIAAKVLTPAGVPAAGAKVALAAPEERIVIREGELQELAGNANVRETDQAGQFRAQTKRNNSWIIVTHRSGYAELAGLPSSYPSIIQLEPWARVAGTMQVARQPEAGAEISLSNWVFMQNSPRIDLQLKQRTDGHGRFAFEAVVPGPHRITSRRMNNAGDSQMILNTALTVDCLAGKTTHADFGVGGRPVIGQFRKPANASPDLQLSAVRIHVGQGSGELQLESLLEFGANADRDGNFSIDDVPPGQYYLIAFFPGPRGGPQVQSQTHRFTVPKVNGKLWQRPVDLGALTLEPGTRR
jgi:hypothetical protein